MESNDVSGGSSLSDHGRSHPGIALGFHDAGGPTRSSWPGLAFRRSSNAGPSARAEGAPRSSANYSRLFCAEIKIRGARSHQFVGADTAQVMLDTFASAETMTTVTETGVDRVFTERKL